jgi:AAA domain
MFLDPWWCNNLAPVLFAAMDLHASRIEQQLARTSIVDKIFDRLDYAWQEKVPVKIEGDARTGKTEAIKAWCSMHPGKARLVSTPSGKSLGDLFKAIAEAIGLPYGPKTKGTDLKEQIQYIMRHAGLFLVFDEAHFLLPASFDRNTTPARLDWVRTQIIDRKLPVALVTTPQAFGAAVQKFHRHTGYNFDQFFGRIMSNLTLDGELCDADLLAVTQIQGADIPAKLHPFIVARCKQSVGHLKAIEAICTRARYIARRDRHPAVTLPDLEQAASELIPARPAPTPAGAPQQTTPRPPSPWPQRAPAAPTAPPLAAPACRAAALAKADPIRSTNPAPSLETTSRRATAPIMETV